jgi:hypothetical protein
MSYPAYFFNSGCVDHTAAHGSLQDSRVRRTQQAHFQDLGAAAAIGGCAGARTRTPDAAAGRSRAARFSSPTAARAVAPAIPTVAAADAGALRTIYQGPYSAAPCSRELVNGRSMLP